MGKALWISGLARDSSYSDIWNMITFWFTYFNGDLVKVLLNSWYGWVIASNIKNEYNYISMFKSQFDHDVAKGASDILKSQSYHWRSQNEDPKCINAIYAFNEISIFCHPWQHVNDADRTRMIFTSESWNALHLGSIYLKRQTIKRTATYHCYTISLGVVYLWTYMCSYKISSQKCFA